MALRKLNTAGHKRVLGRSVYEGDSFKDAGNRKNRRGSNLLFTALDRGQEVVRRIVYAGHELSKSLCVGRPDNDNTVERVFLLETPWD